MCRFVDSHLSTESLFLTGHHPLSWSSAAAVRNMRCNWINLSVQLTANARNWWGWLPVNDSDLYQEAVARITWGTNLGIATLWGLLSVNNLLRHLSKLTPIHTYLLGHRLQYTLDRLRVEDRHFADTLVLQTKLLIFRKPNASVEWGTLKSKRQWPRSLNEQTESATHQPRWKQ